MLHNIWLSGKQMRFRMIVFRINDYEITREVFFRLCRIDVIKKQLTSIHVLKREGMKTTSDRKNNSFYR